MRIISISLMVALVVSFYGPVFGTTLPIASRFTNENIFRPVKIIKANDRVYLLDKADQSVKIFNLDKKLIGTIGRKGAGPGELMNATDFYVSKGNVYLLDMDKIKIFSEKDCRYISCKRIQAYNAMKFCIDRDKFYISFIAYQKGSKLIRKYIDGGDTGELKLAHLFLDCTPLKSNDLTSLYLNFGFLACLKGKVYFAYMLSNKVLEFSENATLLNQLTVPIRPVDLEKLKRTIKGPQMNLTVDKGVIRSLTQVGDDLYLLSQDEYGDSVIFKLESGTFKEMYRIKEKIINFDISGSEIWAIGHLDDIEIVVYKIPGTSNQEKKEKDNED